MKLKHILIILATTLSSSLTNAQDSIPCSEDTLYQKLNFWVGEWKVYNEEGKLQGSNHIEKILNGCAILENWTGGGEGKSLFYVDNKSGKWKQVWVTENSKQPWGQKEKELVEERDDGSLVFQGWYYMKGKKTLDRTILTPQTDETVRQVIQISQDGGENWNTTFIGIYKQQ